MTTQHNHDLPGCAVIGAGGHAAVVLDAMISQHRYRPIVFNNSNNAPLIKETGIAVSGSDRDLEKFVANGEVTHFVIAFGALGNWSRRQEVFRELWSSGEVTPAVVIHPSSTLSKFADISDGCFVGAKAVVNVGSRIGRNCIVNSSAIVEHHCVLGDNVHIAPGAVICGGVSVGKNTFIGSNSVVREGVRIGEGSIIGAGSIVIQDVPSNCTIVGASRAVAREKRL